MKSQYQKLFFLQSCIISLIVLTLNSFSHTINLPSNLVNPSQQVITVKDNGIAFGEGPAVNSAGDLYFTDIQNEVIWKITAGGQESQYRPNSNKANGLVFDAQDRLIACERGKVTRTETSGDITTLAEGSGINEANDLTLCSNGGMYFTSPIWDGLSDVFYRSPEGTLKEVLTDISGFANGIEYIAEKNIVLITFTQADLLRKYDVDAEMNLNNPTTFCNPYYPDGFALDVQGNAWVAGGNGHNILVYDSTGSSLGDINIDNEAVQNCAFGGDQNKTLYIAAKTAVYKLQVEVSGRSTTGEGTTALKGVIKKNRSISSLMDISYSVNPFSVPVRIDYLLNSMKGSQKVPVEIKIYSLNGALVKNILNSRKSPGTYSIIWDGRDSEGMHVPAGVYLFSIFIDNTKAESILFQLLQ